MDFRTLGSTGLSVSVIGFGASPFGNAYGVVAPDGDVDAVACAIDHGINLFDVSPYYGLTVAEQRLGAALAGRRQDVLLATKCGRYGVDNFDFSAATVTLGFEKSLQRLQTDYVDLLQVHDIEFGSIERICDETLPALRKLQEQGKARFIGITGYWPGLLARVARAVPVDTVLNYCHSNLLMDDMDRELTPAAQELGFGLMNASPLHMGLLSGGAVPEWHPAPESVREAARKIVQLCRERGVEPAQVALAASLRHPAAASTFIGLSTRTQVESAVAAMSVVLPPELRVAIDGLAASAFNTVWPSGLAENQP